MSQQAPAEVLSAYLDGQLEPAEAAELERRLENDDALREQLAGMRRVVSNLQHLQRMAPPPTLGQDVARRVALAGERTSLLDRIEDGLSRLQHQSTTFLMFAVIFALALIIYMFSFGLRDSNLVPVVFEDGVQEIDLEVLKTAVTTVMGGRLFEREGDLWLEEGVDPSAPARVVELASPAGQQLLEARPDLQGIAYLKRARVKVDGEVLELLAAP